jgi:hypothetical protein
MRLRRSSSASFEAVKPKGRIALVLVVEDGNTLAASPAAEAARTAPVVCDEKILSDMIALLGGKGADLKFCFRRQGGTSLHQLFVTLDKFIAATGQRSLQLK